MHDELVNILKVFFLVCLVAMAAAAPQIIPYPGFITTGARITVGGEKFTSGDRELEDEALAGLRVLIAGNRWMHVASRSSLWSSKTLVTGPTVVNGFPGTVPVGTYYGTHFAPGYFGAYTI
ncbi:hypothetical protein MSG28_004614 [Choristoneura fumiferana]|uniref:Uncharacterized protein n=1 Tax=Choristoneura fumiferana TaxID=7141 RepID=A0ACC0K785_CHOFU|nr:hypothetical protein MSG28_004614 [Choristoneura fumiferana]